MSRRAKARIEESAPVAELAPEQTPAQETTTASPPPEVASAPADSEDAEQKRWANQGPRGIASIDLGDGRRIQLLRNDAMQQACVTFTAKEGVDPRPTKEDTQQLKDNGFWWRGKEKMWTRQFFSSEDKEYLAGVEAEKGEQQAKIERGRMRADAMRESERVFLDLANSIRQRNGLPPSDMSIGQERTPF